MTTFRIKKLRTLTLGISLALLLSGCGQSQAEVKIPEKTAEQFIDEACKAWAEGLKTENTDENILRSERVIMPTNAAYLFAQAGNLDPSKSNLGKSAYVVVMGNGKWSWEYDSAYRGLLLAATAELIAACS